MNVVDSVKREKVEECLLMASELYHGCRLDDEKYEEITELLDCEEDELVIRQVESYLVSLY